MPDKMTIRIRVEKIDDTTNQTVSTFAIDEKGHVTFRNDAAALATVEFEAGSPFCQGGQTEGPKFTIDPGKESPHKICKDIAGKEFKYTATVDGALPEDPILIIERASSGGGGSTTNPIFIIEMLPGLVVGLLIGAVAGFFLARRRAAQNRPQ